MAHMESPPSYNGRKDRNGEMKPCTFIPVSNAVRFSKKKGIVLFVEEKMVSSHYRLSFTTARKVCTSTEMDMFHDKVLTYVRLTYSGHFAEDHMEKAE